MKIAKRILRLGFVAAHACALAVRDERGQLALTDPQGRLREHQREHQRWQTERPSLLLNTQCRIKPGECLAVATHVPNFGDRDPGVERLVLGGHLVADNRVRGRQSGIKLFIVRFALAGANYRPYHLDRVSAGSVAGFRQSAQPGLTRKRVSGHQPTRTVPKKPGGRDRLAGLCYCASAASIAATAWP